ncbi:MAG TPA: hypothetical protein VJL89_00485 [Thermodesulfovibrionia bacterium]|nr:hypothetical protein [Thermodesulfovibrionia bacterium]
MKQYRKVRVIRNIFSAEDIVEFIKNIWSPRLVVFPVLSALTTLICLEIGFAVEMNVVASVFYVGIFFCFGIVMNTADQRRFAALDEIAQIKANLFSFCHVGRFRELEPELFKNIVNQLSEIMAGIADFLLERDCDISQEKLFIADQKLKYLEAITELYREKGFLSPELSRLHQWVSQIYISFEKLIAIKEYRTPVILRLFLQFSLVLSTFVLAPEFANIGTWGIAMSTTVSFLLISLIEIQNMIEQPFKGQLDNVQFEFLTRFEDRLDLIREENLSFLEKTHNYPSGQIGSSCVCKDGDCKKR